MNIRNPVKYIIWILLALLTFDLVLGVHDHHLLLELSMGMLLVGSFYYFDRQNQQYINRFKESEARYRALFEESITAVSLHEIIVNDQGEPVDYRFIEVNRKFEELTGLKAENLVGRTVLEVMPNTEPSWIQKFGQVAITGESIHIIDYARALDRYYDVISFQPKPMQFVATFVEITDQIKAEEALRAREHLASLGLLAANVAHEINNPNAAIMNDSALIRDVMQDAMPILDSYYREHGDFVLGGVPYDRLNHTLPEAMAAVLRNAKRIQKIIQDLKHLSRDESGDQMKPVDLTEVMKKSASILESRIEKNTDHFKLCMPASPTIIQGRPQQLEQVFLNLLLNALDALTDRRQGITLSAHVDEKRQKVIATVEDQGVGISEKNLKNVAEPFFTTKGSNGGMGLGLSIVDRILHSHDGMLKFDSTPGEGTRVSVIFPIPQQEQIDME